MATASRSDYESAARDVVPRALVRRPLRCIACGYEVASYRAVPPCPMCREMTWEPAAWPAAAPPDRW